MEDMSMKPPSTTAGKAAPDEKTAPSPTEETKPAAVPYTKSTPVPVAPYKTPYKTQKPKKDPINSSDIASIVGKSLLVLGLVVLTVFLVFYFAVLFHIVTNESAVDFLKSCIKYLLIFSLGVLALTVILACVIGLGLVVAWLCTGKAPVDMLVDSDGYQDQVLTGLVMTCVGSSIMAFITMILGFIFDGVI